MKFRKFSVISKFKFKILINLNSKEFFLNLVSVCNIIFFKLKNIINLEFCIHEGKFSYIVYIQFIS